VKRLAVIFCVALVSMLFVGCSSPDKPLLREFPWTVLLNMEFNIISVPDGAAQSLKMYLDDEIEETYMGYAFSANPETQKLNLKLEFGDYKTFLEYFLDIEIDEEKDEDVLKVVTEEWSNTVFIRTRTLSLTNPWGDVIGTAKAGEIEAKVSTLFGGSIAKRDFELDTFRRRIENKTKVISGMGSYQYFFNYGVEDGINDIVIVDRFENGAIWYGIAVFMTAIFMAMIYLIFRSQGRISKNNVQITDSNVQ